MLASIRGAGTAPLACLLAIAAVASVILLAMPPNAGLQALCGSLLNIDPADFYLLLGPLWSPVAAIAGWCLMIAAMMPPLLQRPLLHVTYSSARARRRRAVCMFAAGFASVWMMAGLILVPLSIGIGMVVPGPAALAGVLILALAWSSSPIAQAALNRCHRVSSIRVFGAGADMDCLRYGWRTGRTCVETCWPWMIVPMMAGPGHAVMTVGVTVFLFLERLAPPKPAAWHSPSAFAVLWALRPRQNVLGRP